MVGAVRTYKWLFGFHLIVALALTALAAYDIVTHDWIFAGINTFNAVVNSLFARRMWKRVKGHNATRQAFDGLLNVEAPADPEEAEKRAAYLLYDHLTPKQRQDFITEGHIDVKGSDGSIYRLTIGRASNVIEYTPGIKRPIARWCGYPTNGIGYLPMGDHLLGQKLLIENDAAAFRRVAYRG